MNGTSRIKKPLLIYTLKPYFARSLFFFLLLAQFSIGQTASSKTLPFYGGPNCPGQWNGLGEAIDGCINVYRARYPYVAPPGWVFPAKIYISSASYYYNQAIKIGVQYQISLNANYLGVHAGGTYIIANFCYLGAVWNGYQCILGDQKEGGCPKAPVGNPCDATTGNKFQSETDYTSDTLRFSRVYNSLYSDHFGNHYYQNKQTKGFVRIDDSQLFDLSASAQIPLVLGNNWSHSYNSYLIVDESRQLALMHQANGKAFLLTQSNGNWYSEPDSAVTLAKQGDEWFYTNENDTVEIYNAIGQLVRIQLRNGNTTTLRYNSSGQLETITGPFGKTLTLVYDAKGHLATLTTPDGAVIKYEYASTSGNLVRVIYPDNTPSDETDNPRKTYHYENLGFPHALTGITDENGARFATYAYDAQGRVVSSEHANGVDKITLGYNSNGTTTVTDARGVARTYGFQTIWGVRKNTSLSQSCTNGCATTAAATTYDVNGNVASQTDFNGVKTTYIYDLTRNLETSRTEASGTPQARTITTQWHPTFRLPVQVTEPNRRTDSSYDAQGNVLTRSETALDTNVTRTWRYTYNALGQILTADGPRTDVADVTTYEYWPINASCPGAGEGAGMDQGCRGQLKRRTDAVGGVTEYLKYNPHGQLLQQRDPNGAMHGSTYDVRQQLLSRTDAGLNTTYRYDPRSLLEQISLPSGAVLNYQYDAAHRLIGIQDNAGNRVSYTLDAMGNRLQETVTDPTNTLVKRMTREYDALSRLQRETQGVAP